MKGPYDLSLVEGSITTAARRRAHPARCARSRASWSTIGACATAGGIQALRNFARRARVRLAAVYADPGVHRARSSASTPIARPRAGSTSSCAAARSTSAQLLEVLGAFLDGRKPQHPDHSVCVECKRRGHGLRDGRRTARRASGPVDPGRLRRALPVLRPRLLRLLRARWRRPTPPRSAAAGAALGRERRRRSSRAFRTFNAGAGPVPRGRGRATPMSRERSARGTRRDQRRRPRPRRGRGRRSHVQAARRNGRPTSSSASSSRRASSRRFLRGRALPRGARHHRAHLRHLPGRLPDERRPRDGGRLRRRRSTGRCATLRRLLYCGEWIESHALHVYMLHAPDFLGYESAIDMAADQPRDRRARRSRSRRSATTSMTLLGGREIHPINVRVGGFYRVPRRGASWRALAEPLQRARDDGARDGALGRRASTSPTSSGTTSSSSLRHPDEYPFNEGRIVSSRGLDIAVCRRSRSTSSRSTSPHSNALHAIARAATAAYLVGPARPLQPELRPAVAARARGRARRRASGRSAATRSRASSCARSRSLYACDEALRHHRRPTSRPSVPRCDVDAARRDRLRRAPRRRAACSTTATRSTTRA